MARFGLVGPSYTSQSVNADAQETQNWYPEAIESTDGKTAFALYPVGGLKKFATLTAAPVRAEATINGRMFAIGGQNFYEVKSDGSLANVNPVANDGQIAFIVAGQTQLFIVSAGNCYVFTLASNAWTVLSTSLFSGGPVAMGKYSDGFFFALIKGTNTYQISALLDATSWPGIQTNAVSVFPDNLITMEVDHRELFVASQKNIVGYYDSGSQNIYDVIPGSFIEQGVAAALSPVKADNSVFWIQQDDRGQGIAVRVNGYTPQRISNHAIETVWSSYPTIADAIGYSFQDQGHTFIHWYFPTANASWRYDVATGMWHKVVALNPKSGMLGAHTSQVHCFAFNKHLVGDPFSGNIYEMSVKYHDNNGNAIPWMRRSPHVFLEGEYIYHDQLYVDLETGLGPSPAFLDGDGNPRDPQIFLRWSDDGGYNWSNYYARDCGQGGQFRKRVIWNRLGRARDRVYEISCTDPIAWRIIDGHLKAQDGNGNQIFKPTERLTSMLRKGA